MRERETSLPTKNPQTRRESHVISIVCGLSYYLHEPDNLRYPDPAQDGDQDILQALLSQEGSREGDYHSSPDAANVEDDLDSLFDEPMESQETDLFTSEDAELILPDLDLFFDWSVETGSDAILDALQLPTPVPSQQADQLSNNSSLAQPMRKHHGLTLPCLTEPTPRPPHPLPQNDRVDLNNLPTSLGPDAENFLVPVDSTNVHSLDRSQTVSSACTTIANSPLVSQVSTYDLPSLGLRPFVNPYSRPYISQAASPSVTSTTMDNENDLSVLVSSVDNHLAFLGDSMASGVTSRASSRGRSRLPDTPPPTASPGETTQSNLANCQIAPTFGSSLIRRGNCSPIRSLFTQEPAEQPAKKKRKCTKPQDKKAQSNPVDEPKRTKPQPTKETLRHSLMLDIRAYHYLVEKVKVFMLDQTHPQRYKDAINVDDTAHPDILLTHELNMQDLATTLLLDEDLAENWWGVRSLGYETRKIQWPRDKDSIVNTLSKLLIRVCFDHHEQQSVRPYAVSEKEVIDMTKAAKQRALEQREFEAKNVIECHVSFVLADNLRQAVRDKVIASTKDYPQYMDLVNFLVKLIRNEYMMTGLGILGPLGYAKVNNQMEWEAMLEVIRATPTMSHVALCSVETQPVKKKQSGRKREGFVPRSQPTGEVIEID